MKKTLTTIAGVALALTLAPQAHADYSWVADESAGICVSLLDGGDWITMQISMLQAVHNISRAEAVTGMQQAANGYCPKYASAAPTR